MIGTGTIRRLPTPESIYQDVHRFMTMSAEARVERRDWQTALFHAINGVHVVWARNRLENVLNKWNDAMRKAFGLDAPNEITWLPKVIQQETDVEYLVNRIGSLNALLSDPQKHVHCFHFFVEAKIQILTIL